MASGFASSQKRSYGSMNPPDVQVHQPNVTSNEFNSLCSDVTSNIFTINKKATDLESLLKVLGTTNDSLGFRDQIHLVQTSTNQLVQQTTKELNQLIHLARSGDRQQKLQQERLKNQFEECLKRYSDFQKQIASKMKMCTPAPSKSINPFLEEDNDNSEELIQAAERKQKQLEQLRNLEHDYNLFAEREGRVRQLEADIIDVNEIMRELGSMVHDQGEIINSIESNIDMCNGEIGNGLEDLKAASRLQNTRRRWLVGLGTVLTVIVIVVLAIVLL